MALTDNLIAYWKLDAVSGNESDSVGSNTLADVNTVASASGKINNARDFESSIGQWLTIADNTDLSTGDIDFTAACWIKLESKSARMCFIAKGDGSNGEYYAEYDPIPDRLRFTVCGGSGFSFLDTVDANTLGSPSIGTWYYVVAWHDSVNNQIGISVNAGTADTVAHSTGSADIAGNFYIGSYPSFSLHFDGLIDECGFWKRVLTSSERTSLYNGGAGFAYPFTAGTLYTISLSGVVSTSGNIAKQDQKVLAGTLTSQGSLNKLTNRNLAGTLTTSGVITKQTNKTVSGILSTTGAISRVISKHLSGSLGLIGVAGKLGPPKLLNGVITFIGTLVGLLRGPAKIGRASASISEYQKARATIAISQKASTEINIT